MVVDRGVDDTDRLSSHVDLSTAASSALQVCGLGPALILIIGGIQAALLAPCQLPIVFGTIDLLIVCVC
jgi:hypothetical protein